MTETTTMGDTTRRRVGERVQHSRFTIPVLSLAFGVALLAIQAHVGDWRGGLGSLAIMGGFAALVLFGGRSETIRGLRGDGRDERIAMIDLRATAFAGVVMIIAVIAGFMVELARGHDGSPYMWLGAVGGLAYLAAIILQRVRS